MQDSLSLVDARTILTVKKQLKKLIPELYAISREPLRQTDPRWEMLLGTIATAYVDTLKFRVAKKVGNVKEKRRNQVTCAKCFWWKQPLGPDGEVDRSKNFGQCTNPKQNSEMLAFNPYKIATKEEREEAVRAKPVFSRRGQHCKYAKRKTDLRL